MLEETKLKDPWLVAVWPGMGNVAINAGYYLMAKLGMHLLAEFSSEALFDVELIEVKSGLIRAPRPPRNRLFAWNDPRGRHDIVVFLGDAQPSQGKHAFCRTLIELVRGLGVERVFTFAAMGTQMHPEHDARVFTAATDEETLTRLRALSLEVLDDGNISGLNGVLLGVAAEFGMHGACLLGEMPHIFMQLPFPKASLAVLEVFCTIAQIEIDFTELATQAKDMDQKLGELLAQVEQAYEEQAAAEEESAKREAPEEERLSRSDQEHLEQLFAQARKDRSLAYELKRELDRLGVYREYEDRFLDLFKKST